ncbi:hypothetical protein QYE76_019264 [Lolium multiflorum]|uniref:F-box domain-containing protein n=1 Tax=Lolium multiflorum TaxID=4521 RepID=A0AAD8R3Q8_LOLMU|nr:hypothetical protein QYE76_019264 [Lolium multiflorum]
MMDATEEIPQLLVATNKTVCADGRTRERRSPPSMMAAVSNVLDDDDLLIEILLRVCFPTTLIHAALVCKHWYHHASDCEFLNQFRKRHPASTCSTWRFLHISSRYCLSPRSLPPSSAMRASTWNPTGWAAGTAAFSSAFRIAVSLHFECTSRYAM